MGEYDKSIATANRLIQLKGRTVSLIDYKSDVDDSEKPWRGPASTPVVNDTINGKVVFLDFERKEIDGKNILATDQKVLVPVIIIGSKDITQYKVLIDGSKRYNISLFNELKPGDDVVFYTLRARK